MLESVAGSLEGKNAVDDGVNVVHLDGANEGLEAGAVAHAFRELEHHLVPLELRAIIDGVRRSERECARELMHGAAGNEGSKLPSDGSYRLASQTLTKWLKKSNC